MRFSDTEFLIYLKDNTHIFNKFYILLSDIWHRSKSAAVVYATIATARGCGAFEKLCEPLQFSK